MTRTVETPRLRAERRSQFVSSTAGTMGRAATAGGSSPTPDLIVDLFTWIIVGIIAGLIASSLVGGLGFGLIGDIVVGMVGAVVGGWIFSTLRIATPIGGMPGTILVALIGAVVLLTMFRVLKPGRRLA